MPFRQSIIHLATNPSISTSNQPSPRYPSINALKPTYTRQHQGYSYCILHLPPDVLQWVRNTPTKVDCQYKRSRSPAKNRQPSLQWQTKTTDNQQTSEVAKYFCIRLSNSKVNVFRASNLSDCNRYLSIKQNSERRLHTDTVWQTHASS